MDLQTKELKRKSEEWAEIWENLKNAQKEIWSIDYDCKILDLSDPRDREFSEELEKIDNMLEILKKKVDIRLHEIWG